MGQRQLVSLLVQVLMQQVRDGHGAMTATGTSECDGEIGFPLALIVRQEEGNKFETAFEKILCHL